MLNILLVEDNEGDIELTERAFSDMNLSCRLCVANDGMDALEFLRKQGKHAEAPRPSLILLDLNMPRMDGKEFLEQAKADTIFKSIPVIMFTSSKSDADIKACYERQASCYIVKPFDSKRFNETLRQVVQFWSNVGCLAG